MRLLVIQQCTSAVQLYHHYEPYHVRGLITIENINTHRQLIETNKHSLINFASKKKTINTTRENVHNPSAKTTLPKKNKPQINKRSVEIPLRNRGCPISVFAPLAENRKPNEPRPGVRGQGPGPLVGRSP